jgi:hypothetical protein
MLRAKCLLLLCLFAPVVSPAQDAPISPKDPVAPSKVGQIQNGTYGNPFFGMTFTPPPEVSIEEGDGTGLPPLDRFFGLFHAVPNSRLDKPTTVIIAVANSYLSLPESNRTSEFVLGTIVRNQRANGYDVVNEKKQVQWGNVAFLQADFRRGAVSESVRLTWRKSYALVFIFGSNDTSTLAHLISASRISFAN